MGQAAGDGDGQRGLARRQRRQESFKLQQAKEMLWDQLHGGGERLSDGLFEMAKTLGISPSTLRRAKEKLNVKVRKSGYGIEGKSWWSLPQAPTNHPGAGTRGARM